MLLQEQISQNKNKFEDRAFSFVAPKLWNNLPDFVRNAITSESFKKNLKTHLFQKFYKSKWSAHTRANKQFTGIGAK